MASQALVARGRSPSSSPSFRRVSRPKELAGWEPPTPPKSPEEASRIGRVSFDGGIMQPADAETYYKVVAVVEGSSKKDEDKLPRGRRDQSPADKYFSIYDGRTEYALEEITAPDGGCWVCPSLSAVIEHSQRLPKRSALLSLPRAIFRVAGWNHLGIQPKPPEGHPPSDTKLLITHVRPYELLPYDSVVKVATGPPPLPPLPYDAPGLISAFDKAYPNLATWLTSCGGELALHCGRLSYDSTALLTFHAFFDEPVHAPPPVVIKVLRDPCDEPNDDPDDISDRLLPPLTYPLEAALADIEACLSWMVTTGGPCELILVRPGGSFWESVDLVDTSPASMAGMEPRNLRDNASPFIAVVPPERWAGDTAYRIVDVPPTRTMDMYPIAMAFPRLANLFNGKSRKDRQHEAFKGRHHEAKGLKIGTAVAQSGGGGSCAELVGARGRVTYSLPSERMHSVAAALAGLELSLPPLPQALQSAKERERDGPSSRHNMSMTRLAASEGLRKVTTASLVEQAAADSKEQPSRYPVAGPLQKVPRFPETKALSDIFPEERFPRAEQSLEMRKEGDPAGYDAARSERLAWLLRQSERPTSPNAGPRKPRHWY